MRPLSLALGILIGASLFITTSVLIAWTGPTSAPPNGNVSAPLNVGTTDQIKDGGLAINSLAVFGNAIIQGASRYLNFGTQPGSDGYGIRDNAGVLEFKDSGSAWRSATTTIANYFSSGTTNTISQIKFADGTTQSTAGGGTSGTVGGGCSGDGTGWGNATNCGTQCTDTVGSCPVGYTARKMGPTMISCAANASGNNCGCSFSISGGMGVIYNYYAKYYTRATLCIKD